MGEVRAGALFGAGMADSFWQIIERAKGDRNCLRALLERMSEAEIIGFHDEFREAAAELMDSPYVEHVGPDVSEDTMLDVAEWVVSQGRAFYDEVLLHPEKIPKSVEPNSPRTFSGVAGNVFVERFGRSMHG
jgi:hypothetical protein